MKKTIALLLCLAMALSVLAGCGSSGSGSNGGNKGGDKSGEDNKSVTIGYVGGHYACYPSSANSDDFVQQGMVYDKLFEVDDTTGECWALAWSIPPSPSPSAAWHPASG